MKHAIYNIAEIPSDALLQHFVHECINQAVRY